MVLDNNFKYLRKKFFLNIYITSPSGVLAGSHLFRLSMLMEYKLGIEENVVISSLYTMEWIFYILVYFSNWPLSEMHSLSECNKTTSNLVQSPLLPKPKETMNTVLKLEMNGSIS